MHLPGPLRAAVGLAATAATEAKHLPDRAIELPMLVVSSALQASLRAQQRYARYAARGDEVLNRRRPTEEPPPWATFDDPIPVPELRVAASGSASGGRSNFGNLFGVEDPTVAPDGREPVDEIAPPDEPPVAPEPAREKPAVTNASATSAALSTPATKVGAKKSGAKKSEPKKAAAKKAAAKKAAVNKAAVKKAGAKKAPKAALVGTLGDPAVGRAKTVSKPRHTEPSAFDNVADD